MSRGRCSGQWPARRLFRYRERCLRNFNWRRTFVGFELFEWQFELLALPLQSLRLAPELHATSRGIRTSEPAMHPTRVLKRQVAHNAKTIVLAQHISSTPRQCKAYRAKTKGNIARPYPYTRQDLFLARRFHNLAI